MAVNDHTLEVPSYQGNVMNAQGVSTKDDNIMVLHPLARMSKSAALVHAAWLVALADKSENFEEFRAVLKSGARDMIGAPFKFVVPFLPPSVNHYKKPRRGGGWYRAAECTSFIDAVCVFSAKTKVSGNFYILEIWFFLGPSKRNLSSNDLDNFQKVAIDALVRAGIIKTDGRILDLHLHKRFVGTDREERTEYFIYGRQIDEREVFSKGIVPVAAG